MEHTQVSSGTDHDGSGDCDWNDGSLHSREKTTVFCKAAVSLFYGGRYDSGTLHHRADFQYCQFSWSQGQLLVSGPCVYSL